jgi:nicotinamidase-related amidase
MNLARSRKSGSEIGSVGPMGRLLIRGERGHGIIDALAPMAGEVVIDKASYGAFCGTRLEQILRARGITDLILAGITADVCVHTTLREATDRWFSCHYVADAISCFDPSIRTACERMIEEEGGIWGTLTSVDRVVAGWSRELS